MIYLKEKNRTIWFEKIAAFFEGVIFGKKWHSVRPGKPNNSAVRDFENVAKRCGSFSFLKSKNYISKEFCCYETNQGIVSGRCFLSRPPF